MMDWTSEYALMLGDCEKRSEKLSPREAEFIDSLGRQIIAGGVPTPKQIEWLDSIWERVT